MVSSTLCQARGFGHAHQRMISSPDHIRLYPQHASWHAIIPRNSLGSNAPSARRLGARRSTSGIPFCPIKCRSAMLACTGRARSSTEGSVQWPFCIAFVCPWARKGGSHPDLSLGSLRSLTPLAPPSDPACSMRRRAAAGFCLGAHRGRVSPDRARRLRRAPP